MAVKIINYKNNDILNLSLPLIIGEIIAAKDSKIIVQNETFNSDSMIWPVVNGGGGLALFGSGCLHTWPQDLQEVPWRFGDKRKIDRMNLMDDSANRGWYWACYSTGLGSTLHELGHTFDLGHTNGGIMGRGFDDIHKYFIVDMFYHDHLFQKEHNPHYQDFSIHNHTKNNDLSNKNFNNEKPWRIPNPPDYLADDKFAVHVGGAYWTRSSALILYFH
ncbi:uncharacterized protein CEXT_206421, partial [Caerostris extrusa]